MLDRVEWLKARSRRLERGDFRASDADREDAARRLRMHVNMGHLSDVERQAVVAEIESCGTPNEIAEVFVKANLPDLPARSPSTEARISSQERTEAFSLLEKAYAEGRLMPRECAEAKDRVEAARTRGEVDAAFHGLPSPSRVARTAAASTTVSLTAAVATGVAREAGRRAGRALRFAIFGLAALMVGFILLVAGMGSLALLFFLAAVALLVGAAISLMSAPARA